MFLINALDKTAASAKTAKPSRILDSQDYSLGALSRSVEDVEYATFSQWECYAESRKAGSPRELSCDQDGFQLCLKQKAPLKCVDRAWLKSIHNLDTP